MLHDIDQAARYADHMVAMQDGAIYATGTPEAVVTEELLADVFEVEARVSSGAHGPRITSLAPLHDGESGDETDRGSSTRGEHSR